MELKARSTTLLVTRFLIRSPPKKCSNELSIHLANNAFNHYNTEELFRWKIQYLYNHAQLQYGVESANWHQRDAGDTE
jgi:hypothetical protein